MLNREHKLALTLSLERGCPYSPERPEKVAIDKNLRKDIIKPIAKTKAITSKEEHLSDEFSTRSKVFTQ